MIIDTKVFLFLSLIVIAIFITAIVFLFFRLKNIYAKIQIIIPFNSLTTIFIAIYCYYIEKPEYIDMALAYSILSFVGILGLKRYFELSTLKKKNKL